MSREGPAFAQPLVTNVTLVVLGTSRMFFLQMNFVSIFIITHVLAITLLTLENFPLQVTPVDVFTQIILVLGFVVTILVLTWKLSLLPVSVDNVFPESARLAERVVAVLAHYVVDVTLHVVLEDCLRGVLLLAVCTLIHYVIQDKPTFLGGLSPVMIQEFILGAEKSAALGTGVLSKVCVCLSVDLNLENVLGGEVTAARPLARVHGSSS